MQAESSLWGRKRVVGSKLKHDGTLGYISRGAARRSGLNPAGWHRYVPIAVVAVVVIIALAALGYAGGGASLGAMFKSPELAHAGTELVEGAQGQTGVAPQRGMVAVAATIADAQKDDGEQKAEGTAQTGDDGVNLAPNQATLSCRNTKSPQQGVVCDRRRTKISNSVSCRALWSQFTKKGYTTKHLKFRKLQVEEYLT